MQTIDRSPTASDLSPVRCSCGGACMLCDDDGLLRPRVASVDPDDDGATGYVLGLDHSPALGLMVLVRWDNEIEREVRASQLRVLP